MHTGSERTDDFSARRGDAWELGMRGEYDRALTILEELLRQAPDDLTSLRMKGNLLELRALDFAQYRSENLLRSKDYVSARECYERILKSDPDNTVALTDLGDHYKNLDAHDRALDYYMQAVGLLEAGESRLEWREEVQEILNKATDLAGKASADRVARLEGACRKLLSRG